MKKKKSLYLSATGLAISASATVTGVLLTETNNDFDANVKPKNIEVKKNFPLEEEIINDKRNLLDEIKDNVSNNPVTQSEVAFEIENKVDKNVKDEKTLTEEDNTITNINDKIRENELTANQDMSKQLIRPKSVSLVESTQSGTDDETRINSELNTNMDQVNLNTLLFHNKNKTHSVEIQSLPNSEDFKTKIVDKIRTQKGFDTLEIHHIEITWNDGENIMDDYFTEQKVVLTSEIRIKGTNVEGTRFIGTKDILIHWLNKQFSWESLEKM